MIKAIIFDYGNVLDIPDDWATWLAHRDAMAARYGLTGEGLDACIFQSEAWQQVKRGRITFEAYLGAVFGPLGLTDPAAQAACLDEFFKGRLRVHPVMRALLQELKPRYRLSILSNAYQLDMADWLVKARGLVGIFEDVVSSAAVGMAKPEPEIYQLALARLGLRPDEALFVDDMPRNTTVAESLGLSCIVFESPEQLRRTLAARGLI
jgi:putative hydrolase of the HAD superfamily